MTAPKSGERSAATVEEHAVPPVGVDTGVFLAQNEGQMVKTVEQVTGEDGSPVTTTHTRPGTMTMYKPTKAGYVPKTVSRSALGLLTRQGWREVCPDCKSKHLDKQGQVSTDPNLCSARDPVAVRVCPVCQKRIYDNVRFSEDVDDDGDVNVIREEAYEDSSGATRTKALLDAHLWQRHERQAAMMGVPPLPVAMRDTVGKAV